METLKLGMYRHYKGNDYKVIGTAIHSETRETLALYVPQYGDGGYWVRPLSMFLEEVEIDGVKQPRFAFKDA